MAPTDEEKAEDAHRTTVPCPFVYARGKSCTGHIVRVEAYKADLLWTFKDGRWSFRFSEPRSHFHLFCSEKGNHAGYPRRDSDQLKFYWQHLPEELREVLEQGLKDRHHATR
jgi:hypothetical protein